MLSQSYSFYAKDPLITERFLGTRDKDSFLKPLEIGEIVELDDKEYQIIAIIHKPEECKIYLQPIADYVRPLDYNSPIKPLIKHLVEKVDKFEKIIEKLTETKKKNRTENYI